MTRVIPIIGDQRCETLLQSLRDVIYERATGMPMPIILGTIEILKFTLIKEASES